MDKNLARFGVIVVGLLVIACDADGRGFGGFRGGSFGGGGFDRGSYGGFDRGSYGGFDRSSYGGFDRSSYGSSSRSGWGGYHTDDFGGYSRSYDRTYDGSRGGSYSASGTRGAVTTPWGGATAHSRDVTATGPEGRTYSSESRGVAGWNHFATDGGLARYSSAAVVHTNHTTAYWSHGYTTTRAGYVRTGFGYYHTFRPNWYVAHPGAWRPAAWTAAEAWAIASWATLATWFAIPEAPVYYDYGNTVTYQNNNVYVNGTDVATAEQYNDQAVNLATQGQQANPPATDQWQSLGVFALVQGEEKTSNNIFQLAVNQAGTIRGNYYDGLMDTTTPVYGSVDKKTQRAAWTIGKKTDRVFETGLDNLTKDQTPLLVHFGKDRTQQWLLVRMQQPQSGQ